MYCKQTHLHEKMWYAIYVIYLNISGYNESLQQQKRLLNPFTPKEKWNFAQIRENKSLQNANFLSSRK